MISQKATCQKYDEMLDKMYSDPPDDLKSFVDANADVFAFVSKHTGAVSVLQNHFKILKVIRKHIFSSSEYHLNKSRWTIV